MFLKLLEEHPGKVMGGLAGLLLGLIFLLVGFWKTIIFLSFVAIGVYLGRKFDNNERFKDILEEIIPDKFFK